MLRIWEEENSFWQKDPCALSVRAAVKTSQYWTKDQESMGSREMSSTCTAQCRRPGQLPGSRCRPWKIAGLFFQRTNPINRYILLWISILRWVPGNEGPGWQQTLPTNRNLGLLEALKTAFLMNVAKQPQRLCLCTDSGPSDLQFQARISKSESVSGATQAEANH